jgi:hypothetical protein
MTDVLRTDRVRAQVVRSVLKLASVLAVHPLPRTACRRAGQGGSSTQGPSGDQRPVEKRPCHAQGTARPSRRRRHRREDEGARSSRSAPWHGQGEGPSSNEVVIRLSSRAPLDRATLDLISANRHQPIGARAGTKESRSTTCGCPSFCTPSRRFKTRTASSPSPPRLSPHCRLSPCGRSGPTPALDLPRASRSRRKYEESLYGLPEHNLTTNPERWSG